MNAAELVEKRKTGSITQEEFFVALNQLRRENSARGKLDSPAQLPEDGAVERDKPAVNQTELNGGCSAHVKGGVGENSHSHSSSSSSIHSSHADGPVGNHAADDDSGVPRSLCEPSRLGGRGPAPSLPETADAGSRGRAIETFPRPEGSPPAIQLRSQGDSARLSTFRKLNRITPPAAASTADTTPVESRRELRWRDQAGQRELDDESEWIVSPSGEARRRCHSLRKTPEFPSDDRRKSEDSSGIRSSTGALSQSRSGGGFAESCHTATRNWRPAGESPPSCWQGDGERLRSRPETPPRSRSGKRLTTTAKTMTRVHATTQSSSQRAEGTEERHHLRGNGSSRQKEQQTSPVISRLEEAKRRTLSPGDGGRRRRAAEESVLSVAASDEVSIRHASMTKDRSKRYLYQDDLMAKLATRRPSGSPCVCSLNTGRHYTAARRDRHGYPLHDRKCFGISSMGGVSSSLFAPMTKQLPEFYQTMPKRTPDIFLGSVASTGGAKANQPTSVYERSTGWQARASEIRARKLAQREEQEMEACTFQPNAWRRRPNAPSGYANTVGNPSLDREGDRSGVGEDAGGGSSAEEPQGEHATGRAGTGAGGPRRIGAACQRLFEESKRLKERRFEAEERKRMWEEESYARTCTFKPSLVQGAAVRAIGARARYRDPPPAPAIPEDHEMETLSFQPKIIGVHPGMTRAKEYVSVRVAERLYRAHQPARKERPTGPPSDGPPENYLGYTGTPSPETWEIRHNEHRHSHPNGLPFHNLHDPESGSVLTDPRSERLGDRRRIIGQPQPRLPYQRDHGAGSQNAGHSCGDFIFQGRRRSEGSHKRERSGRPQGAEFSSTWEEISSRPHSAPPAARDRERGGWRRCPHDDERLAFDYREQGDEAAWDGAEKGGGSGGRGNFFRRDKSNGMTSNGPRRQTAISFREFLARQAHSQVAAKQHLTRLTRMHSPSFTPKLSRRSRQIAARNGVGSGGGCFEDRLNVTERRRQRDKKAAHVQAMALENKACTFSPKLTTRSQIARSRSARELSLGDSVLRAAKQRMVRARQEIRLLEDPDRDGGSFMPILATEGDPLAPPASSSLRLKDELDTYLDRVQEAAMLREEKRFRHQQRVLEEEARACTFKPEVRGCPDLVRRTAAGMRCVREFRRREALASTGPPPPPKAGWR